MAEGIGDVSDDHLSAARAAKAAGQLVVGVVGFGAPIELILATGAYPVRVVAQRLAGTPSADALIGAGEPADMRALVEDALNGTLEFLDLLVVTRSHEWLYYFLKEAVRMGVGAVPALHMHDLVPSTEGSARAYNRQRLERLTAVLERLSGVGIDVAKMAAATLVSNKRRAILREVQRLRDNAALSGSDALTLVAESHALDPVAFADNASDWLKMRPAPRGPRLLLLADDLGADGALHHLIDVSRRGHSGGEQRMGLAVGHARTGAGR